MNLPNISYSSHDAKQSLFRFCLYGISASHNLEKTMYRSTCRNMLQGRALQTKKWKTLVWPVRLKGVKSLLGLSGAIWHPLPVLDPDRNECAITRNTTTEDLIKKKLNNVTATKSHKLHHVALFCNILSLSKKSMIFSKACEYAIKASIFIAKRSVDGGRANLKEIAAAIESPVAFTAKILQQLVKKDIILSIKGASGGFEVDVKRLNKIRLIDIVIAIDGELNDKQCALGLKGCSHKHPCPVHDSFIYIRSNILSMLKTTTLHKLSTDLIEGFTYLKR